MNDTGITAGRQLLQGGGHMNTSATVLGVLTDLRISASAVAAALVTAIVGLRTAAVAVGGRGFWPA